MTENQIQKCRRRDNIVTVALLCSLLPLSGAAQDAAPSLKEGIATHEQALARDRAQKNVWDEAIQLFVLATLYDQAKQQTKAIQELKEAASVLDGLGAYHEEAMSIQYIGGIYQELGQLPEAIRFYNLSLPSAQRSGDLSYEASIFIKLGNASIDLGQPEKALEYFTSALSLAREANDLKQEVAALNMSGQALSLTSRSQEALERCTRALLLARSSGDTDGELAALENIAEIYKQVGQYSITLRYLNQAMALLPRDKHDARLGIMLDALGGVYQDLGHTDKAVEYMLRALEQLQNTTHVRELAIAYGNLGGIYGTLGQKEKGLGYLNDALTLLHKLGDKRNEAMSLLNIAGVYTEAGDQRNSLLALTAALQLGRESADPNVQGEICAALMANFAKEKQSDGAILFGLSAINYFQQIRRNISDMNREMRTSFIRTKSTTYRQLAELLVQNNQLALAEQVLDLLKEAELKEVVRGMNSDSNSEGQKVPLTPEQQKVSSALVGPETKAAALIELSLEYQTLSAKPQRRPAEDARLKVLDMQIQVSNDELRALFTNVLFPQLARRSGLQGANGLLQEEKSQVSLLQGALLSLGPRVIGVRLLFGETHVYAIMITPHARREVQLTVSPGELRKKILIARDDLRSPSSDPMAHLAELYQLVVSPLDSELAALERIPARPGTVPTILWSLDGVLRYLPMSALYDGKRYMVERFNNVLFTPEGYRHMTDGPGGTMNPVHALAMGLSKSFGGLPALPEVMKELEAVVHDPGLPQSHGPLEGLVLPDEHFTFAALKDELSTGNNFVVVHIASHFVAETGADTEPYLMLGGENTGTVNGFALTLSKFENSPITFHGTRLLTLSACSTARDSVAGDGMEIESLSMVAQQKDAQAVIATLWDVRDDSTSLLMSGFYARWVRSPSDGKAEALRQAQLAFLKEVANPSVGGTRGGTRGATGRVERNATSLPGSVDYSHPYFWSTFVLTGNYQ